MIAAPVAKLNYVDLSAEGAVDGSAPVVMSLDFDEEDEVEVEEERQSGTKRARVDPAFAGTANRSRASSDLSAISVSSGASGFVNLVPLRRRSGSDMSLSGGAGASISSLAQTLAAGPGSGAMSLVPLRLRTGSDASRAAMASLSERVQRDNWRSRLWPTKAQINFIRAITRCSTVTSVKPHDRLTHGNSFSLEPSWDQASLPKVSPSFKSIADYSMTFFRLLVEEARASVTHADDSESYPGSKEVNVSSSPQWCDLKVIDVVAATSDANDQAGSIGVVWLLTARPSLQGADAEADFMGGDLLAIYDFKLERYFLGVVHTWDPDYEQRASKLCGSASKVADDSDGCCVNIMVTVDQKASLGSASSSDSHPHGWFPQGLLTEGASFSATVIGNTMTSIREAQALMSLKYLHTELQNLILDPTARVGKKDQAVTARAASSSGSVVTSSSTAAPASAPTMRPPTVPSRLWAALEAQYNESQLRAIGSICGLTRTNFTLLQGPPGTGKTRTILAIVAVILAGAVGTTHKRGQSIIPGLSLSTHSTNAPVAIGTSHEATVLPLGAKVVTSPRSHAPGGGADGAKRIRVLVCAPSNAAANEIAYRLQTQGVLGADGSRRTGLAVIRIGQLAGRNETDAYNRSSPSKASKHAPEHRERSLATTELLEINLDYLIEKRRRRGDLKSIADVRREILLGADVVCATLSGSGSQQLLDTVMRYGGPQFGFDAVIIDEAAQAVETSALVPLKFNPETVIMVGDPCQLAATVFSRHARESNFDQSLFQRLQLAGYPMLMLTTQYRMHADIAAFPSGRFYNGLLLTDPLVVSSKSHERPFHSDRLFAPLVFHDVADGRQVQDGTSIKNPDEVDYILSLYRKLQNRFENHGCKIGIITPYNSQRKLLKHRFRNIDSSCHRVPADVEISTIDGFQGREVDIVIFSCVRSGSGGSLGFLAEWQRLNVAITRAKYSLWVVGNLATLEGPDTEWRHLAEHVRSRGLVVRAGSSHRDINNNNSHRSNNNNNSHRSNNSSHRSNNSSSSNSHRSSSSSGYRDNSSSHRDINNSSSHRSNNNSHRSDNSSSNSNGYRDNSIYR